MHGVLLVDKPEGTTSAGVIRALRARLGRRKVGHLGTLDPFASGLLPLCVGEATKVARYLIVENKAYEGSIRLGVATETLDPTGAVTERVAVPELSPAAVAEAGERFLGEIRQTPPMFSAIKQGGVPLYRLARKGVRVEREARRVRIDAFDLELQAPDRIEFRVRCSKGTYVRVLAADLGRALGTVAHLERLRRTAVGRFHVRDAWSIEALREAREDATLPLVPIAAALVDLARFTLSAEELATLRRGQQQPLAALTAGRDGETALLISAPGEDVRGLIQMHAETGWRLVRLIDQAVPPLQG
jgi:tRNA pseudouridine55 synthase